MFNKKKLKNRILELEKEVEELNEQILNREGRIVECENKNTQLIYKIKSLENKIGTVEKELEEYKNKESKRSETAKKAAAARWGKK